MSFLRLAPKTNLIAITGSNGAGKTNLLEAISLLSPGRGLRRAAARDLQSTAVLDMPWGVAAELTCRDEAITIGIAGPSGGRADDDMRARRRTVALNGKLLARHSDLGAYTAGLWLTPQMDGLFAQGGSERRRFLDRMTNGLDPSHAVRLSRYEKVVRERNRLLQMHRYSNTEIWLDGIEHQIAETGVAIAAARRDLVLSLQKHLNAQTGPFPQAELSLVGTLDVALNAVPAAKAEADFLAVLRSMRQKDAAVGTTTEGAHRTDLEAIHRERGLPARSCSTGEQKAVLLAITLAFTRLTIERRGLPPLLLLDEAGAHLDMARQEALCSEIAKIGCQCWMTGTDAARFAEIGVPMTQYIMVEGQISEET